VSHEKDQEAVEDRSRTRRVEEGERRMQSACNQLQSVAISGNQWHSRTRRVEEGERRMEQRSRNPPMELA
jgi:hypothetical protein